MSTNSFIRDAKGLSLELKRMLSASNPWDREVEFQRESLRKAYLRILFSPFVPSTSTKPTESPSNGASTPSSAHTRRLQDVLNLLWLETSHAFILAYRAKLTEMDRVIAESRSGPPGALEGRGGGRGGRGRGRGGGGMGGGRANSVVGPTARRRLTQLFTTFMGHEEDFFRTLLGRLTQRLYPSDLVGLQSFGLAVQEDHDEQRGDLRGTFDDQESLSEEEKESRRNATLPLVHKALIYFGDLARYGELYRERGAGNGVVGAAQSGDRRGRGTKGRIDGEQKGWNYARASECYNQARILCPDNGNPSNQLAVLSQYTQDSLSATYHYYRALAVRSPFPTARTNINTVYTKAITAWYGPEGGEPEGDEGVKFRVVFGVLHGLYCTKTRVSDIRHLAARTDELFKISIEQRLLPSEIVLKSVVTGICALWNARLVRSAKPSSDAKRPSAEPNNINIEPFILTHVLSTYSTLLSVAAAETNELVASNAAAGIDAASSLALNISAVLRRILLSIRILSKWITAQLDYALRLRARVEATEQRRIEAGRQPTSSDSLSLADFDEGLRGFWKSYVEFNNVLRTAFPPASLPSATEGRIWLEEDVELLGCAPLSRASRDGRGNLGELARVGKDVHPNEEELMRVADVQKDAIAMAAGEGSLISFERGMFVFDSHVESASVLGDEAAEDYMEEEDQEELGGYGEEGTEDDPVDLAMRISTADRLEMDGEDEDDDEEIVYTSLSSSQILNQALPPLIPRQSPIASPDASRNANDLLHRVLGGHVPTAPSLFAQSSSPPISNRSIWSASTDGPSHLPPANAATITTFESIPNQNLSRTTSIQEPYRPTAPFYPPSTLSLPLPTAQAPFQTFPVFSPFTPSRPLPLPSSFQQTSSDLSPLANAFSRSPNLGYGEERADGWPDMRSRGGRP